MNVAEFTHPNVKHRSDIITNENNQQPDSVFTREDIDRKIMNFVTPWNIGRENIENIKLADWKTFNEEAAACHIFMAFTKNVEAKKTS